MLEIELLGGNAKKTTQKRPMHGGIGGMWILRVEQYGRILSSTKMSFVLNNDIVD